MVSANKLLDFNTFAGVVVFNSSPDAIRDFVCSSEQSLEFGEPNSPKHVYAAAGCVVQTSTH